MKIKQKKQFTLPQLIEYIWDNGIKNECFRRLNRGPFEYVWVNEDSNIEFDDYMLFRKNDIFEIEIEEEITEDTKLDTSLDHFINPYGQHYVGNIYHNRSINDILEENDELEIATNFIHILDKETKEFKLIWRNGKLVE